LPSADTFGLNDLRCIQDPYWSKDCSDLQRKFENDCLMVVKYAIVTQPSLLLSDPIGGGHLDSCQAIIGGTTLELQHVAQL
jgi:hypothetical protein